MKKNYHQILKASLCVLLACAIFSSCQKDLESQNIIEDKNYIDQAQAISLAIDFRKDLLLSTKDKQGFNIKSATSNVSKKVRNSKTLLPEME